MGKCLIITSRLNVAAHPSLLFFYLVPMHLQAKHNEAIRATSRADMVNGHILALPFSDRYIFSILLTCHRRTGFCSHIPYNNASGIRRQWPRQSSTPASTRSQMKGLSIQWLLRWSAFSHLSFAASGFMWLPCAITGGGEAQSIVPY